MDTQLCRVLEIETRPLRPVAVLDDFLEDIGHAQAVRHAPLFVLLGVRLVVFAEINRLLRRQPVVLFQRASHAS